MKKLLGRLTTILVYALTFLTPAAIVQIYSRFVDPMTPSEVWMATLAGTVAMLILAAISGFSGRKPPAAKLARRYPNVKAVRNDTLVIKDPGSQAETLFRWNDKEKLWESDHGTYLDEDHLDEWLKQRASDRQWANNEMKKLRQRNTAFDRDIDALGQKKKR